MACGVEINTVISQYCGGDYCVPYGGREMWPDKEERVGYSNPAVHVGWKVTGSGCM